MTMQLLLIQSLLMLGVLALPALSASLPGMEASNAVSTRHSLHRRFNHPIIMGSLESLKVGGSSLTTSKIEHPGKVIYSFTQDLNKRFKKGVLRHRHEAQFYHMFQSAIDVFDDVWLLPDRKEKLRSICDDALAEIRDKNTGPIQYDVTFALTLFSIVNQNVHNANLKQDLQMIMDHTIDRNKNPLIPDDIAKVLVDNIIANHSNELEKQVQGLYAFLHHQVFGYPIQPGEYPEKIAQTLMTTNSADMSWWFETLEKLVAAISVEHHSKYIINAMVKSEKSSSQESEPEKSQYNKFS